MNRDGGLEKTKSASEIKTGRFVRHILPTERVLPSELSGQLHPFLDRRIVEVIAVGAQRTAVSVAGLPAFD